MPDLCLSGIQPTNVIHIGNYIGALKQWKEIQNRYPCLFCIVDLHAITVPQDPKALRDNILNAAATYLATGIDPKRSKIFIQSEVPEHTELNWILSSVVRLSELMRMTQFKDKARKLFNKKDKAYIDDYQKTVSWLSKKMNLDLDRNEASPDTLIDNLEKSKYEKINLGLLSYPVLMAADILLYNASAVPVGEDQMQHLELARTIGRRFNQQFGDTFAIPEAFIQKAGARIMALDDPTAKMSKSASSAASYIALTDGDDVIRKKIMRAVTDSGSEIVYDPKKKPALANLLTIYHHMTGAHLKDVEKEFEGKGYGDFKKALAEAVIAHLSPIRAKIAEFRSDKGELTRILNAGRDAAKEMAEEKMKEVREKVGLGR